MTRSDMLVVFMCCMMKLIEMTSGKENIPRTDNDKENSCYRNGKKPPRRKRRRYRGAVNGVGVKGGMAEVQICGAGGGQLSPDSDCNSNHTGTGGSTGDHFTTSCLSNTSQDMDFVQDNSDYQWFLDYGYREGGIHQHTSVLSSLSASYGGEADELGYYDVLAKNLDANLAEADMESFRTEDIHSLLTTLPAMCTDTQMPQETNHRGEMFASMSGSMMAKFDFDSSGPHSSSQGEDSTGSVDTMSICKSELLFSPVKETPVASYSVDSLDCALHDDLMLTCQANKDNYTIAFEGSLTACSEDSDYHDTDKSEGTTNSNSHHWQHGFKGAQNKNQLAKAALENSMARSDTGFTTWSKLKKRSSEMQLRRHPSGNNNTTGSSVDGSGHYRLTTGTALKSQSMPNLYKQKRRRFSVGGNKYNSGMSTSSMESYSHLQRFPVGCIKVFDIQHHATSGSILSDMASSVDGGNSSCGEHPSSNRQPHNFNLVKRFMKQKSISADGMSLGLDHSSASEGWRCSQSDESGDSCENKHRYSITIKSCSSMNGSFQEIQLDNKSTDERSTCTFEDSLVQEQMKSIDTRMYRTHDLIEEEEGEEGISERSESVEQLSESVCKIDSEIACDGCDRRALENKMRFNPRAPFNVNNNNSIEREDSPNRSQRTQTKRVTDSGNLVSSDESNSISMCSSSEGTDTTKMQNFAAKTDVGRLPLHLIDRSMQTSSLTNVGSDSPRREIDADIKIIEPSFLSRLKEGDVPKPVYVLYPNYTLPDLEFLREKQDDIARILLMPQKLEESDDERPEAEVPKYRAAKSRRPFSCNDVETLKRKGFGHVRDWDSLTFLLPTEYRAILAEVPEVARQMRNRDDELPCRKERLSFCVSPPARHRPRPISCDLAGMLDAANPATVSSSSSTATQPSSGYRGSSTMLLTDSAQNSPAPSGNYNPLFVYRYDSATSSEASCASDRPRSVHGAACAPPLPKRSISLPNSEQKAACPTLRKVETAPPRPPLPKGILRKTLENCKMRKNYANNKRYSAFETNENIGAQDLSVKRRSAPEAYCANPRKSSTETDDSFDDEGVDAGTGTESSVEEQTANLKFRPPTPPLPKNTDDGGAATLSQQAVVNPVTQEELQQLEEYLKQSGISCSDGDDWDDRDMLRLRSHVAKFLTLKINQNHISNIGKKSVSFSDKIRVHLREEDSPVASAAGKLSVTPPNSPSISAFGHRHYQGKAIVDMPICEENENSSPERYDSPPLDCSKNSVPSRAVDLNQKRSLVSAVTESVEQIINHFSPAVDRSELNHFGDSSKTPHCAKLVLSTLCPALYAVLSDGLKPNIDTTFGAIGNSVWQVVEASAQSGPLTESLNQLVLKINGEDVITEGLIKFNAFVFGLLNVRSLDAWAGYLRTRESVLRKHYNPDALLLVAHTGGSAIRALLDTLLSALQPLAMLPFQLDLLYEYRQLHASLKRMSSYQQPPSPSHYRLTSSPTPLTSKQWALMKLVRSIQSSTSQSFESEDLTSAAVLRRCVHADRHASSDPSLPDLLNSSAYAKTQCREDKLRPRSCVDANSPAFTLTNDVASTVKKRWSGIHPGSKLYQAYDRLAAEDTEEEYTDSLEHHKVNVRLNQMRPEQKDVSNSPRSTTAHEEASDSPSIQEDALSLNSNLSDDKTPLNGGKFRRLQMKWEMLSSKDKDNPNGSGPNSPTESPAHTPGSTGSTGSVKSRIPRLITSPSRSSTVSVASSPPLKTAQAVVGRKLAPSSNQPIKKPPAAANTSTMPPAKGGVAKRVNIASNRTSRVDRHETNDGHSTRAHPVRPSSLPYRPATHGGKGSKTTPPRRAVSSSAHRSPKQNPVRNSVPKVVRTLSHRLPSDTGHLSFNEGERLKVVLEVDDKWLLCCRGDRKGLVPKSAVIAVPDAGHQF